MENDFTFTLNDGLVLPAVGFGTYGLNGRNGAEVIKSSAQRIPSA